MSVFPQNMLNYHAWITSYGCSNKVKSGYVKSTLFFLSNHTTKIWAQKVLFIEYGEEPRNLFLTKFYRIKNLSNSNILILLEIKPLKASLENKPLPRGDKRAEGWGGVLSQNAVLWACRGCCSQTPSNCATLHEIRPCKIPALVRKGLLRPHH